MEIDNFRGVYSSREPDHTTQTPGASKTRKRYWLVWDDAEGTVTVQPLSPALEPSGVKRIIPLEDLDARYVAEPDVIPSFSRPHLEHPDTWERISPAAGGEGAPAPSGETVQGDGMDTLLRSVRRQTIDLDDMDFVLRDTDMGFLEEDEPAATSKKDVACDEKEREMRAEFGMGLMRLKQGDSKKAMRIFENLLGEKELVADHKHMFTDFGISLRKSKLLEMALKHHLKAVELGVSDENACHNVARIYYELGDINNALRYLKMSLELNPALDASERFMRFIRKRQKSGPIKLSF